MRGIMTVATAGKKPVKFALDSDESFWETPAPRVAFKLRAGVDTRFVRRLTL